jgi:hypothetical protein
MGIPTCDAEFSDRPRGCGAAPSVARRLAGWQIQRREAGRRSGSAAVSVAETTDLGLGDDPPWFGGSISRGRGASPSRDWWGRESW